MPMSSDPVDQRPANARRERGWGLLLVLAVVLVYAPVGSAGFVWDDQMYITGNANLLGWAGLKAIWTTTAADISPLTLTTFWIEHALWGLAPLPYHLVNVLLHAACAVLLGRVLLRLGVPGAWFGAALWALHPVQVESVAWITETKNTQSAFFFLLSILFFLRWLGAKQGGTWNYALVLLFAALAMASKSSTVILPVVLCLAAWWSEGRWRLRPILGVVPVLLVSVIASAATLWTVHRQLLNADPQWHRSLAERIAEAGDVVWFYLGKLIWPPPLSNNYPRWQIDAGQWISYLPTAAVIVVLVVLWLNRKSWARPYFFAFAYFLAVLLPVLGLVDHYFLRYSLVADHLQYLAAMGPLALVGSGLARWIPATIPWLRPALATVLLGLLAAQTWSRAHVFQSEETLWSDTLIHNPASWSAHNNLGLAYFARGDFDAALAQGQQSLALNPNNAGAHCTVAMALLKKGRADDALVEFRRAIELDPLDDRFYAGLGQALAQKGNLRDAIPAYLQALAINPRSEAAHSNLGVALFQTGHAAEAMDHFRAAVAIDPDSDEAHNNLGNGLLMSGHPDEAIAEYEAAVALNPQFAGARRTLGVAYARQGKLDAAIAQIQAVVQLSPDDAQSKKLLDQLEADAHQRASPK